MHESMKPGIVKKPDSGLRARIITALILAPIAICGVIYLPSIYFALILGLLICYGMWEWTRIIGLASVFARALVVGVNAAIMGALLLADRVDALQFAAWVGVVWWCIALLWLRGAGFGADPSVRNLLIKILVGSAMMIPAWAAGWLLHRSGISGPWWTLFVLMFIWAADIGAYFTGRRFGRVKLAPRISPGKTREGVYGALACALLFAATAGYVLPTVPVANPWLIGLVMVTVIFSIVGDLFESLIKRQSQLKDSGSLLPGHGGMLDRIDSLLAALPIFVCGRYLIGL